MRLELTALAASDYDNIIDHSFAEFGNVAALAYVDAVEAAFRQLTEYPFKRTSRNFAASRCAFSWLPEPSHLLQCRRSADRYQAHPAQIDGCQKLAGLDE